MERRGREQAAGGTGQPLPNPSSTQHFAGSHQGSPWATTQPAYNSPYQEGKPASGAPPKNIHQSSMLAWPQADLPGHSIVSQGVVPPGTELAPHPAVYNLQWQMRPPVIVADAAHHRSAQWGRGTPWYRAPVVTTSQGQHGPLPDMWGPSSPCYSQQWMNPAWPNSSLGQRRP